MNINKKYMTVIASALLCAGMTSACSEDSVEGDPSKDWAGTTQRFITEEEAGYSTYYKPTVGRIGDPMPFYDKKDGLFKVYYLQEFDNNRSHRFHPIWGVSTADGCNYESMGEVIPFADNDYAQDAAIGTGCCWYDDSEGQYYMYYTGHNGNCQNREVVMRATSKDGKTWVKDNLWSLKGTDFGCSAKDFRDPQIFEDGNNVRMIISTYPNGGNDPKFAEFVKEGNDWKFVCTFNMVWDRMLECPDVFKMGNYWYLVYSESFRSDWSRKVKYMMADSWENLKMCLNAGPIWPADDREGVLDTRAFYAGKTASNGTDRYIWGWSPYRSGSTVDEKNLNVGADGEPNWSGALVCHKLVQHSNGTLSVGEVPAMAAKYNKPAEVKVMDSKNYSGNNISGDGYVLYNRLGDHNHISFTVKTSGKGDAFGVSFVRGSDSDRWYTLRCQAEWDEQQMRKVNFEQQGTAEGLKWFVAGADGYLFPRPGNNTYDIDIYTDNSVVVMYVNHDYGTTQRIYGLQKNCWSIDSFGGNIEVTNVKVSQY